MTTSFAIAIRAPILRCVAAAVLALLWGCASMSQTPRAAIADTRWALTELDGETIDPGVTATLVIGEGGRVSGSDGCNRFVGGLVFDDHGKVAAAPFAGVGTKMACRGSRDAVSRRYNALRAAASSWRIEGGSLVISTADGKAIRLRRAE